MIDFHCPNCGAAVHAPDSYAGKRARCATCQSILTIPNSSAPPSPAAPANPNLLHGIPIQPARALPLLPLQRRRTLTWIESTLLVIWRRYRLPAAILLLLVLTGVTVSYYLLRDTWEPQHAAELQQRYTRARALHAGREFLAAAREYQGIAAVIGPRRLRDRKLITLQEDARQSALEVLDLQLRQFQSAVKSLPAAPPASWQDRLTRCAALLDEMASSRAQFAPDQLATLDTLRQTLEQAAAATLRLGHAQIETLCESNPPAALPLCETLLAEAARLRFTDPETQQLVAQVTATRDRLAGQQRALREYLASIDPVLQQAIPFLRRLRWGMPERMFMERAAKLTAACRAIKDPPDRTTTGELLALTNGLASEMAVLEQAIQEGQAALRPEALSEILKSLRPADVSEQVWSGLVAKYVTAIQKLVCIGKTVRPDPAQLAANFERVKRLEFAYREVRRTSLGQTYAGEWSMIADTLDPARRTAYLEALERLLEAALPTFRRLERGIEREVLLTRLAEIDAPFGTLPDPPDDSGLGEQGAALNRLCEAVYLFALTRPGQGAMDQLGLNDPAARELNDSAERLQRRLREARLNTTPAADIQAYAEEKKRWLEERAPRP